MLSKHITFHLIIDQEADRNRGWQIDQFEARIPADLLPRPPSKVDADGNVCVGYVKGSLIPPARLDKYYPKPYQLFAYARMIGGWCGVDTSSKLGMLQAGRYCLPYDERKLLDQPNAVKLLWKQVRAGVTERFAKDWISFLSYHTRPFVDYSRVHDAFQRQGIATTLYKLAGNHYAQQGYQGIRSSGCQSEDARQLWLSLQRQGLTTEVTVKDVRGGKLLSSRRLCLGSTSNLPPTIVSMATAPMLDLRPLS